MREETPTIPPTNRGEAFDGMQTVVVLMILDDDACQSIPITLDLSDMTFRWLSHAQSERREMTTYLINHPRIPGGMSKQDRRAYPGQVEATTAHHGGIRLPTDAETSKEHGRARWCCSSSDRHGLRERQIAQAGWLLMPRTWSHS